MRDFSGLQISLLVGDPDTVRLVRLVALFFQRLSHLFLFGSF